MSSDRYSSNFSSGEDWQCNDCGYINWARRQSCNGCRAPKTWGSSRSDYSSSAKYRSRRYQDDADKGQVKRAKSSAESGDTHNEFDVFGKSVSAQLKKLSVEEAVMAQAKIQTILSDCRMNDVKKGRSITDSDQAMDESGLENESNGAKKESSNDDDPETIESLFVDNS